MDPVQKHLWAWVCGRCQRLYADKDAGLRCCDFACRQCDRTTVKAGGLCLECAASPEEAKRRAEECIHGQPRRACPVCEANARIEDLRGRLETCNEDFADVIRELTQAKKRASAAAWKRAYTVKDQLLTAQCDGGSSHFDEGYRDGVEDYAAALECMRPREEQDARKPLPPEVLANALQDKVHKDIGHGRAVKTVRNKKITQRGIKKK